MKLSIDERIQANNKLPYAKKKHLERIKVQRDEIQAFEESLKDDRKRIELIKENFRFSNKILVSNKKMLVAVI